MLSNSHLHLKGKRRFLAIISSKMIGDISHEIVRKHLKHEKAEMTVGRVTQCWAQNLFSQVNSIFRESFQSMPQPSQSREFNLPSKRNYTPRIVNSLNKINKNIFYRSDY